MVSHGLFKDVLTLLTLSVFPVKAEQIPFLATGEGIGHRVVVAQEQSQLSGGIVIEDVVDDAKRAFRRLIFMSNPNLIQSEARLQLQQSGTSAGAKKKKQGQQQQPQPQAQSQQQNVIDYSYLASDYQKVMLASFSFMQPFFLSPHTMAPAPLASTQGTESASPSTTPQASSSSQLPQSHSHIQVLMVGLGSGAFAMFLHNFFAHVKVDVVELDPAVATIAKNYFGLKVRKRHGVTRLCQADMCVVGG